MKPIPFYKWDELGPDERVAALRRPVVDDASGVQDDPLQGQLGTYSSHPNRESSPRAGKKITKARPLILSKETRPQKRPSSDMSRLSPITKMCPSGTTIGPQLSRVGAYVAASMPGAR